MAKIPAQFIVELHKNIIIFSFHLFWWNIVVLLV